MLLFNVCILVCINLRRLILGNRKYLLNRVFNFLFSSILVHLYFILFYLFDISLRINMERELNLFLHPEFIFEVTVYSLNFSC